MANRSALDSVLGPLQTAVGTMVQSLRDFPDTLKGFTSTIGQAVKDAIPDGVKSALSGLGSLAARAPAAASAVAGAGSAVAGAGSAAVGMGSDAIGGVATALGGLTGGLTALVGVVEQFVEALDPNLMQQFSDALQNVNATIGQAFAPVVQVATEVMNQLSGALGPVARELAPVMQKLATVLTSATVPMAELVGSILTALVPVLDLLAEGIKQVQEIVKVLAALFKTLVDALKASGFISLLAGIGKQLADVFKQVVQYLIEFGAALYKTMVGSIQPFIDNLKQAAEQQREQNAAPRNAAIKTFAAIRADITNAAFTAGGLQTGKTQDEQFADMVDRLTKIEAGTLTLQQIVDKGAEVVANAITTAAATLVNQAGARGARVAASGVTGGPLGAALTLLGW